jgi:hypothetical protein
MLFMIFMSGCVKDKPLVEISNAQETVLAIINLPHRNSFECGQDFMSIQRENLQFDVNSYFKVLDHLEVEDGYILDYVQGGRWWQPIECRHLPIIYAVEGDELPLRTSADYCSDILGLEWWEDCNLSHFVESKDDYLRHIVIEDTHEGYFQFVTLATIGDLFPPTWRSIITTEDEALKTFTEIASWTPQDEQRLDSFWGWRMKQSLKQIDYTPRVELSEDFATVRITVYHTWGGVVEIITKISRNFPHEIISWDESLLLEYKPALGI